MVVEKNVSIPERFFDNHYNGLKRMTVRKIRRCGTIKNADEYGYSPSDDFHQKTGLFLTGNRDDFRPLVMEEQIVGLLILIFLRPNLHDSKADCELNQKGNVVNLKLFHNVGAVGLYGT